MSVSYIIVIKYGAEKRWKALWLSSNCMHIFLWVSAGKSHEIGFWSGFEHLWRPIFHEPEKQFGRMGLCKGLKATQRLIYTWLSVKQIAEYLGLITYNCPVTNMTGILMEIQCQFISQIHVSPVQIHIKFHENSMSFIYV